MVSIPTRWLGIFPLPGVTLGIRPAEVNVTLKSHHTTSKKRPIALVGEQYLKTSCNIMRPKHQVLVKRYIRSGYFPEKVEGIPTLF